MRIQVLCALVIWCGAEVVQAQSMPPNAFSDNSRNVPASYGSSGSAPPSQAYYQGNGQYPNAFGNAPNPNQQYPTGMTAPQASPYPQDGSALPGLPLGVEEGEDPQAGDPSVPDQPGKKDKHAKSLLDQPAPKTKDCAWLTVGYELAFIRPERLFSPLVTTGSLQDVSPGAVGQPGTAVLLGNSIDFGAFSGGRLNGGFFLDDSGCFSIEGSGQYAVQQSVNFARASDATGNPVITRPFFDVSAGAPSSLADSVPGALAGGISVDAKSEFWGTEISAAYHWHAKERLTFDGLFGFRFLRLAESLTIQDQLQPLVNNFLTFQGAPIPATDSITDQDSFVTANNFYGLQLGGQVRWDEDWFSICAFGKVALGANDQMVDINGSTTLNTPGAASQTASGGVLALPSNIGNYNRTIFGVVPEVGLKFGVIVCPHVLLTAGYSFLYWDQVVRPAGQIDNGLNPAHIPSDQFFSPGTGAARPAFTFSEEAFWINNFTFGVEFHY